MQKKEEIRPWSVRKSEHVLQDPWISLRADECVTADGLTIAPYYVLEHPDWVNLVVLDSCDRVLVIRQYRHGIGKIAHEIPGGGVDESDASPLAAAERELLEETGYGAGQFTPVSVLSANAASHTNYIHCFLVTGAKRLREPSTRPDEEIEFEFVDISTLMQLIDSGGFPQSIQVASIFLALRKAGKLSQVL